MKERRKHERFPIMDGLLEPVNLRFDKPEGGTITIPAILTNISAGGMSMVAFSEPPHARRFELDLKLPGLHHIPVEAKILWIHSKGETHAVGMSFQKINRKDVESLIRLAQDYNDCDTRIGLRLPEACVPVCTFHLLCKKAQKTPHWPPKV